MKFLSVRVGDRNCIILRSSWRRWCPKITRCQPWSWAWLWSRSWLRTPSMIFLHNHVPQRCCRRHNRFTELTQPLSSHSAGPPRPASSHTYLPESWYVFGYRGQCCAPGSLPCLPPQAWALQRPAMHTLSMPSFDMHTRSTRHAHTVRAPPLRIHCPCHP